MWLEECDYLIGQAKTGAAEVGAGECCNHSTLAEERQLTLENCGQASEARLWRKS